MLTQFLLFFYLFLYKMFDCFIFFNIFASNNILCILEAFFNLIFAIMSRLKKLFGSRFENQSTTLKSQECRSAVDINAPSSVAIIYRSEFDIISRFILDYPNIETGGQLFGYWTSLGTPVVLYAIGPGKNAQHYSTSFIQDWDYLQLVGKELHARYRLQHIGEWHSHHQLGLAHPSGGDVNTMSFGVGKPGFPRLLLCIGNCNRISSKLNAFNFQENAPADYVHARWDIVEQESPYRRLIDMDLQRILIHPITKVASHEQIYSLKDIPQKAESIKTHWLTESVENVETMKTFVSMIKSMYPLYEVKTEILKSGEPQIAINDIGIYIKFPFGFPTKSPILLKETTPLNSEDNENFWRIGEDDLIIMFGHWLESSLSNFLQFSMPMGENVSSSSVENITFPIERLDKIKERIKIERQVILDYFHPNAFVWNDFNVVTILAYPFLNKRQGVIRMTMPPKFPNVPPIIHYGFYNIDPFVQVSLSEYLTKIVYKNLSDLCANSEETFYQLLKWESHTTILQAYVVACIMIDYVENNVNAMHELELLLADGDKFEMLMKHMMTQIKQLK